MEEFTIVQKIAVWALPLLFAITLHEVAHGWVASFFGDQTARLAGRLSFNPIRHIDIVGTIILPLIMLTLGGFIFGWAKPVPVDQRNMQHPRVGMIFVAIAGPLMNILMAVLWALIAKLGMNLTGNYSWFGVPLMYMGQVGIMINIVLGVLNCLPIPPLDGWRVIANLLPGRVAWHAFKFEQLGFLVLVVLLVTGVLAYVIMPPISWLMNIITSLFGLGALY